MSDLWSFNLTTNLWTWLSGASRTCDAPPNQPPDRVYHTADIDTIKNVLYVFGGQACDFSNFNLMNQLNIINLCRSVPQ